MFPYKWVIDLFDHRMYIFGLDIGGGASKTTQGGSFTSSGEKTTEELLEEEATKTATTEGLATTAQTAGEQTATTQDVSKQISSQSDVLAVLDQLSKQISAEQTQQTTAGQQETAGTALTEGVQTTQTLDVGTQNILQDLIAQLAGTATQGGEITEQLTERALTAEGDLAGNIEAIVSGARARGEKEIGRRGVSAAQEAGSSMNSIVQQLGIEGAVDLETQLAELEASLGLQTRQLATGELAAAGAAAGAGAGAVTQLADVLKGAETTGTTQQTQQTQELVQSLQDLLGTTTGTVETATEQKQATTEQQQTAEQQTVTQLTDVLSQMDQTQMTSETQTAVESLMKLLSGTETFAEAGTSEGTTREVGGSFGLSFG